MYIFKSLFARVIEGVRKFFHLPFCSSDACNSPGWARPKSGVQESIWVSNPCVLAGTHIFELSSTACQDTLAGIWLGSEVASIWTRYSNMRYGHPNSDLICCIHYNMCLCSVVNCFEVMWVLSSAHGFLSWILMRFKHWRVTVYKPMLN